MKPSTSTNTYSLVRMEIVAAFVNGLTLMALAGFIFYEAVERLGTPPEIKGGVMLAVAAVGMVINLIAARILWGASHDNMNIKGALLHVLGDFAGSVGAVVAAVIVINTGWTLVDPIVSMFIGLLIIHSSWKLLKESLHVLLEGAPRGLDTEEITRRIKSIDGVCEIHDFHVWSLTTGVILLTAHICVSDPEEGTKVLESVTKMLDKEFGLSHSTIQIEDAKSDTCRVSC
jgi:cobalt-zinc-cadmium efflux system protein